MPDYAVNTAFNASGDILRKITDMTSRVSKFGRTSKRSFNSASRAASNFKSTTAGILAAGAINKGISQLERGLSSVTSQFIDYDQAVISASAKFKGLNLTTKEGIKTMDALKKSARDLGATTEFTATQAAQGLDFLAMAGFSAEQAMASLPGVVDLATVANVDLARATDIASDSLGAFGLMTDDTTQLQANFIRVNDVMAKTMTSTNTSMEDLFETIKKGGSAFTGAGQSMETFNALAGVMANAGQKGSESGTALRNVMLSLAKPTGAAAGLIEKMGVNVQDSEGNFRDMLDILADLEVGLKGMGSAQRSAALETIFGRESATGINNILDAGTDKIRDFRSELIKAGGTSKQISGVMRGSIGNQLKSLGSAASEMGFKFFDAFENQISPAIQSLTQWVREFDVSAMVAGVTSIINVVVRLKGAIFALVGALAVYKLSMAAMGLVAFVKNIMLVTRAVKAAILAQGLWNAIMMMNPIGLIIAGISALVGGIWLLVDNFNLVVKALVSVFKWMGEMVLGYLNIIMTPFKLIWEGMKKITSFFGGGDDESSLSASDTQDQINNFEMQQEKRQAPNQASVEVQQVNFNGQLNIAGAPQGSTFEDRTRGPSRINTDMLGAQM